MKVSVAVSHEVEILQGWGYLAGADLLGRFVERDLARKIVLSGKVEGSELLSRNCCHLV